MEKRVGKVLGPSYSLLRVWKPYLRTWVLSQQGLDSPTDHTILYVNSHYRAVRLSWLFFAYPCLLLAYTGQAAYISIKPEAVSNPFFNTVPSGIYYPSLVLSILAAIVASQAMITGSFQLLSQCMSLSYFPKVKLLRTSIKLTFHGQIYIPLANWLMMIGTIIVTAVYNNVGSHTPFQ